MAGETILIVEDNESNMVLTITLLTAAGYEVIQATSAEEGIALAKSAGPALILMDISLPGMDGLAAAAILKSDPRTVHIPIVALTAHVMKGDDVKALAAGCSGYVSKPIDTRAFARTIRSFIDPQGA
ncbi:MAG: response regulator [Pseudomonadota bacterium]